MPALETIQAATVNAAELLGQSEVLGTIEAGKFADIIAVDENPQDNIKTMTQVKFVMKEGKVYKN